jgi:hypothetical protein
VIVTDLMPHQPEFHWLLGPTLVVTFAFLGNTLFLTILVSMLSNTFSTIVANATAEIQFRRSVLTLEGVKGDAIFAYQPPFNILALFVLVPMKFLVNARWFHKIHVSTVRALNLPILLIIALVERRYLSFDSDKPPVPSRGWFWEKWKITTHGDIKAVFEISLPDSVIEDIAVDDEMTHHLIRKQFARKHSTAETPLAMGSRPAISNERKASEFKKPTRRDSIAPYGELTEQVRNILNDSSELGEFTSRLSALEESTSRIERMLGRLAGEDANNESAIADDDEMVDDLAGTTTDAERLGTSD